MSNNLPAGQIPMDQHRAETVERDCLCSGCWGRVNADFAPGRLWFVRCINCGENTPGYVSKAYVERREQENKFEAREIKRAFSDWT